MKRLKPKHPLAIRWFHWLNFPILAVMIWSGLLIYWAYGVYRIGFGSTTLIKFFPKSFYEFLNVPFRLGEGMQWHFVFMWLFGLNGALYAGYTLLSGEWRNILPHRSSFREAWHVTLYDLGLRKEKPRQTGKYNAAQRVAYTLLAFMGLGSLLTGLAIYKPVMFRTLCWLMGGYESARVIHFALTLGFCLFFLVHIAQVVRAGWNKFRGMVTGWEVDEN